MKITYKCAHCGWTFPASKTPDGKTPKHAMPSAKLTAKGPNVMVCAGAGQKARVAGDVRPLGKDLTDNPQTA